MIRSQGYTDELAWAAIWLYKATGDTIYLREAEQWYNECCRDKGWAYSWESKKEAVQVMSLHGLCKDITH